jgi:hypothetical protein
VSKQAVTEAIKTCCDKRDGDWLLILGFALESGITELSRSFGNFQVSIVRMHGDLLQHRSSETSRWGCVASTALVSLLRTVLDNEPSLIRPTVGALVLKTEKDLNRGIESGAAGNKRLSVGSRLAMHQLDPSTQEAAQQGKFPSCYSGA